ncbi:hypothetical protein CDD80_2031 [Ophiocordyceps camponoti-rufipedis]|uniref:Alanine racemase N-terminal domain-containing protein n=1 Tax=Ophiocordyceps camponoti-rufipedis TaxID=2004952 RepID=A0A2C5XVI4_9HYPO|nr:hypothetical protein CDD80_2031 [Ophiocordyceps camponoti-rufipedis]
MRLQVGPSGPVRIVVSTLAEAEFLLPALLDLGRSDRPVNILYGLPLPRSAIPRLSALSHALGPRSISVLVDDPAQVPLIQTLASQAVDAPLVFIKIDMGGRRAGVTVEGERMAELVAALRAAKGIVLAGLYSHAGHSYAGRSRGDALRMLGEEIGALGRGAERVREGFGDELGLVLSVGASPTALAARGLADDVNDADDDDDDMAAEKSTLTKLASTPSSTSNNSPPEASTRPASPGPT